MDPFRREPVIRTPYGQDHGAEECPWRWGPGDVVPRFPDESSRVRLERGAREHVRMPFVLDPLGVEVGVVGRRRPEVCAKKSISAGKEVAEDPLRGRNGSKYPL